MPINFSVGEGGRNIEDDTTFVQRMLSDWRQRSKGTRSWITIDGIVGPETIGAIRNFQQENQCVVDGRIDPEKTTIKTLERLYVNSIIKSVRINYLVAASRTPYRPFLEKPIVDQAWITYLENLHGSYKCK